MKIGLVQMDVLDGRPEANLARAEERIAGNPGADLYLLPELFTTGYDHDSWPSAGAAWSEAVERMRVWAETSGAVICGSLIAAESGRLFNRMVAVTGNGILARYDKIHLFGVMEEDRHLTAGGEIATFEAAGITFGMAICYDLRFPAMFQKIAARGVQAILVASEWPEPRCETLKLLATARAVENQCYLALSNRIGAGRDGTAFCRVTMLVGPGGEVELLSGDEGILVADVDPETVSTAREQIDVARDRVVGLDT